MTQEEKDLLLQDLCARLPYGIVANCVGEYVKIKYIYPHRNIAYISHLGRTKWESIEVIKPYLRPMSSMTEEERKELLEIAVALSYNKDDIIIGAQINSFRQLDRVLDLFNAHHLDYRGLIKKGLALEAPEGMYNINNK